MYKEFEGRNEQEAIDKAISELGLDRDDFDVEILSREKKSLFRKGSVTIRVHVPEPDDIQEEDNEPSDHMVPGQILEAENENERKIIGFVKTLISKMGYEADVNINFRRDYKIGLEIVSDSSSILIGRKGKNLDAIQLLANVYTRSSSTVRTTGCATRSRLSAWHSRRHSRSRGHTGAACSSR